MRIRQIDRRHAFGQWHRHMRLGQHQAHAAVFKHMQQAFTRVLRVQRHIGATGLEHRQQADHHVERTLDRHAHQHFRANALADQVMREAVGLAIQFGVADGLAAQTQGNRVGPLPHLGFEQTVYTRDVFERRRAAVPVLQQPALLVINQHPKLRNTIAGTPHHCPQHPLPMLGHTLHSRSVEQVGGVGQRRPDAFGRFLGIQAQVELCALAVPLQRLHAQARQLLLATRPAAFGLMVEHHLEQRVMAQAALGLQGFHQLFERQVLVTLGLQCTLLDLGQQLAEGHLPVDVGLEYLGVDEEADQALGFCPIAVGNRHADADIRLPAVAIQQGLERRQQQHEQGHAFALGQRLETVHQCRVQANLDPCTAIALHCRARVIQRQLQHWLLTAQLLTPIAQLTLFFTGFHPAALPQGVVRILDRQARQVQVLTLAVRDVQLHQLVDHHLHRPTIGDDVMQYEHQHVIIGRQLQQLDPQQRALLQIERLGDFRLHPRFQLRGVAGFKGDFQVQLGPDHLQHVVDILMQIGPQAFVAADQAVEAALQGRAVQAAFQTQGARQVVGRAVRLQLPQKPLPFLSIREPKRLTFLALENRGNLKQVDALLLEHYRQRFLLLRRK
ncbi:hypothetical protein [Pseudomonas sp. 35 E 8]|nr:hypothetical protein [Pseudomonas sp. 35 E 8]